MPVRQPKLAGYLNARNESWKRSLSEGIHSGHGNFREVLVHVHEINDRNGTRINRLDSKLAPQDVLIRGNFFRRDVQPGLTITCGDSREEHPFSINSQQTPGLSCIFFLKGHVDLLFDRKCFEMAPSLNRSISAACLLKSHHIPFERITHCRQDVCHLVVTATPEWLDSRGFYNLIPIPLNAELHKNGMVSRQWLPSVKLAAAINDILEPTIYIPELLDMQLEARAIEIVSESIGVLIEEEEKSNCASSLNRHDKIRLQRAKEMILSANGETLSVDIIAREVGISSSGLQRLFRRAENCSVFDFTRTSRLNEAKSLLLSSNVSVQEVSALIGYRSPANFTTAFKRHFGITPSKIQQI